MSQSFATGRGNPAVIALIRHQRAREVARYWSSTRDVHFRTQFSTGGQLLRGARCWSTMIISAIKRLLRLAKGSVIAITHPSRRVLFESGDNVAGLSDVSGVRRCK